MTVERVERRLAAVLAADVAGYSRLMGIDEEGTLARLKVARKTLVDPAIASHRGRIVKTTGDGMLVEFGSAVDAVCSAVEVQRRMAEQNAAVPQDQRIEFRIGINVGDVIIDGDDIFGDGVNVAARVEAECEPGGVYLSANAFEQIRSKTSFIFDDMGERNLKNIDRPVRVYSARTGEGTVAAQSNEAATVSTGKPLALPDKPSIAVLPFQNMSGDPEQEYFADGLVEDVITALSRFKSLFVIARNSSFTYKGKAVDIKHVGRELGVRYVLEGSVRKAAARLRITAQLIDTTIGAHLWADRFDGALEDIFELQDSVTQQVVGAIAPELDRAEIERARRRPTSSIDAVTEHYRGMPHLNWPTSSENNDIALQHFKNAMAADPSFPPPYGGAAGCLAMRRMNRWPLDIAEDDALLLRLAKRVKELNTDDAFTLTNIGLALFHNKVDCQAGIELVDQAIRSNPNFAFAYQSRGFLQVCDGKSDAAIADFEHTMRLNPRDPWTFNSLIGIAFGHFNAGRYAEAAVWADKCIRAFPYFLGGLRVAIGCYAEAGRTEDAQGAAADLVRLSPKGFVSKEWSSPIRSPEVEKKMLEAYRKAGLAR